MYITMNCGKCFKDNVYKIEELDKKVKNDPQLNLYCSCGHPLIKKGEISLRN